MTRAIPVSPCIEYAHPLCNPVILCAEQLLALTPCSLSPRDVLPSFHAGICSWLSAEHCPAERQLHRCDLWLCHTNKEAMWCGLRGDVVISPVALR